METSVFSISLTTFSIHKLYLDRRMNCKMPLYLLV